MASILQSVPRQPSEKPQVPETETQSIKTDGSSSESLLNQIAAKAEKSVPDKMQDGFHRIMAAGRKAMFSEKTFPEMQKYLGSIQGPQDIPQYVSHGVVKLLTLIFNQSKGAMPLEPVGLAATLFMCDALEYLEEVKQMPIDKAVIDQTTLAVKDGVLLWIKQASGISEEEWQQVMSQGGKPNLTLMQGGKQPAMNAPPAPTAPPVEGEV